MILLVFLILSLVSFASLSLVSARADARLTEKYRAQTDAWYSARNESQRYLKELSLSPPEDGSYSKHFPAGEAQELILEYRVEGGKLHVTAGTIKSTVTYDYDSTLPVFRR